MKLPRLILLFLFMVLLTSCGQAESTLNVSLEENLIQGEVHWPEISSKQDAYVFGFDRRLEPKEDVKIYASLLKYLEQSTGYEFILEVTPKDGSLVDEIGDGEVDFAVVGTLTYLQAHELYKASMLVRGINSQGENVYRAAIVTRPDTNIKSIFDLRDSSFVFGASTSTQGYLIPRRMLEESGIELTDLRNYDFTSSHAETANAVISGRSEAGGIQDTLAQTLVNRGLLRIVAWSNSYPSSGVLAGEHVPQEVVQTVTQVLLGLDPSGKDKEFLYHWERTEMPSGFSPAKDEDYAELRSWAEAYGLLEP